jgi:amidase
VKRAEELAFAGVDGALRALRAGELSARELVQLALERIEASQPQLNAFRCLRPDAALREAEQADRRRAAGEEAPLLGVPVAIKDDTDLAGETTEFGCRGSFRPKARDGEAVRRLKLAGAVIVGKTTTPELGQWPITEGPAFGVTRNPWSLDHTPGGSSGGSAAAVAAGLVAAALGSDGLGSIRVPAAWTHLVGIKPQRGRVSTWPYTDAFCGLTCIGPLARTVADAAALLDAVAGNHPRDRDRPPPFAQPLAAVAARADPGRPLRIALSLKLPYSIVPVSLAPEVAAAVRRLALRLEQLGHRVEEADPVYGLLGAGVLARSIAGLRRWVDAVPDRSLLDPRTLATARVGRWLGGPVLRASRALEGPFRAQVGWIFRRFDVLLTPTTARPAMPVGAIDGLSGWETDKAMVAHCPCTWPWNVTGWPAVSVPAGLTADGLPVGAQLLGPACSEPRLVALAAQLERAERWQDRRPPYRMPARAVA